MIKCVKDLAGQRAHDPLTGKWEKEAGGDPRGQISFQRQRDDVT